MLKNQSITKPLTQYYTKELLGFRRSLEMDWAVYNTYIKYEDEWRYHFNCNTRCYPDIPVKPNYTISDLKQELSKRPHIPNKKESKKLRQEAAKRKT